MRVLAIDPGTHQSAFVVWNGNQILVSGIEPNETLLRMLQFKEIADLDDTDVVAIEMIASYGMAVGREVFETCVWIGRFFERCRPEPRLVYRKDMKLHHCQSARAKDANINQALRDKYGEKGTKNNPGVTYGLKSHTWAAFAIATFISETSATESEPETLGMPPPDCVAQNLAVSSPN